MWKVKGYGKSVCGFEGTRGKREKRREWLSGGVSPCQGEGRGFESRLVLIFLLLDNICPLVMYLLHKNGHLSLFYKSSY